MSLERLRDPKGFCTAGIFLTSVLVLFALIVTIGCAKSEVASPPSPSPTPVFEIPADFSTYTDEAGLYSISYPQEWEPALSQIPNLETSIKELISSIESNAPVEQVGLIFIAGLPIEGGYAPNVNIAVEALPGVNNHDQMVEAEIRGMKQVMPDLKIVSQLKTTVDGRDATIMELQGTYPQLGEVHCLLQLMLVGKSA